MELPKEIVGEAYADARSWELLEQLVDIENRMPGGAGEAAGAELVAEAFEHYGLRDVQIEEFEIPGWWRGSSSLSVSSPVDRTFDGRHELVALPGTPADSVDAPIVDLGYALPPDFDRVDVTGKIVLATASAGTPEGYHRPLHRSEKYRLAAEHGAAGLLFYSGLEGSLPPTGWAVFARPDETPGPIPAAGVSYEVGRRLVRWAADDEVQATFDVDCENRPTASRNVEATVGPDSKREVLVTAHIDAHDLGDGARDNGAGTAIATEVGRLLTRLEGQLDTRVRIVVFGSEEVGLNGAQHWARTRDLDRVKCVLNLDGIGGSRDLKVLTHGFDGFRGTFDAVADELHVPIDVRDEMHVFSDQWEFVQRGVPGASCQSVPASDSRRWGLGRLWSHTHGDTLDKLDPRDLRDLAVPITAAVTRLADDECEIDHRPPTDVRDAVPAAAEEEMRYNGRWPWD